MTNSFVKAIEKTNSYKTLPDEYKVSLDLCHPLYPHLTFKVTSLSQYLEIINIIKSVSKKAKCELVFRGMADHSWDLLPSIARKTLITDPSEHKMVSELMLLYPGEFTNISSNFDLLAKMQHYGLPTRLLDFTTNPLVALFFACYKEKKDSMGRVISTLPETQPFFDEHIEEVCGLHSIKNFGNYFLENLIENVISFAEFIYCMKYPLFAKPQYSNDRIKNQSAMFMVFQNEVWDYGAMSAYECFRTKGTTVDKYVRRENQDILQRENLQEIYPQITTSSSNIENWFVTYETLSKICNSYKSSIDAEVESQYYDQMFSRGLIPFKHRFSVVPQIKKIDNEIMRNAFCSILIEPKHKKKILEELDSININERFLFPELEYTVKYVKDKYWLSYKGVD